MESLPDSLSVLQDISGKLGSIQDILKRGVTPERVTFSYPKPSNPSHSIEQIKPQTVTATASRGLTTVDFHKGKIDTPEYVDDLNADLQTASVDSVRAINLYADTHAIWSVPNAGKYYNGPTNGFLGQMREVHLRNLRVKELKLQFFEPSEFVIYASTTNDVNAEAGPSRSFERVTYDKSAQSPNVSVGPNWNYFTWGTESAAIGHNVNPSADIHVMNLGPQSVVFANNGSNKIQIAAEVKDTLFKFYPPDNLVGTTELDNWTENSPQTIPAGEKLEYDWSSFPFHFIKFKARVDPSASGTSSKLAGALLATTV